MKKYVFFDIDNTLLPEGETKIPQKTVDAIQRLKDAGAVPFICTGRPYAQAKRYIEQIKVDSYITSNGQEVNVLGKNIYSRNLQKQEKEVLLKEIQKKKITWGFETRMALYIADSPKTLEIMEKIKSSGIDEIALGNEKQLMEEEVKQIWVFGEDEEITALEAEIIDNYKFFRWSANSLEILPLSESKGKGVKKILELSNEDIKTYAFGDGFNDIQLLETVDVGVAMGNAQLEVKAVADHITADCTNDGITKGLEELGLI